MKALSVFYPYVLPYVPGCPNPMAKQAIRSACIEFAGRSCVVQNTQSESAIANQPNYDVEEPSGMTLVRVLAVYYGTRRLEARSREMVNNAVAARGENVGSETYATGTPNEWFNRDPAEPVVSLYPVPYAADTSAITIVAAHQPAHTATRVADILFDDYAEDIANGALARLLSMPNQPFSNPALAERHEKKFVDSMRQAAAIARVGLGAASSRVRPRSFA